MFYVNDKVYRNTLLSCDHGLMIVNRFDTNANGVGQSQCLLDHGNLSTLEATVCSNSIKDVKKPIIFDVGANIGTFTTWLSKVFPQGKIYSFEPQREVFQMLCGNIAINNLYNVYTHNIALGQENTKIKFREPNYFVNNDFGTFSLANNIIKETTENEIVVQLNTLDWFMDYYEIPKLDLLKIDVEGMDLDVLKGASETIKKYSPVIFVEHTANTQTTLDELKLFFDEYNYSYKLIENNMLCTPPSDMA